MERPFKKLYIESLLAKPKKKKKKDRPFLPNYT